MTQRRHISVWLLLAAFVLGGVAAPVLHQVQHGTVEVSPRPDEPCHTAGVHQSDRSLWTEASVDLTPPDCTLCATRLLVVLPTPAPTTSPRVIGTTDVALQSHVAAARVATDRFIRGPPSRSEARPA